MAIARFPVVVLDCPDPQVLAQFYGALLDWPVEKHDGGWWSIRADYGDSMAFQGVEDYTPPRWPGQDTPQQMHLDVVVDTSTARRRRCSNWVRPRTSISRARRFACSSIRRVIRSVSAWAERSGAICRRGRRHREPRPQGPPAGRERTVGQVLLAVASRDARRKVVTRGRTRPRPVLLIESAAPSDAPASTSA